MGKDTNRIKVCAIVLDEPLLAGQDVLMDFVGSIREEQNIFKIEYSEHQGFATVTFLIEQQSVRHFRKILQVACDDMEVDPKEMTTVGQGHRNRKLVFIRSLITTVLRYKYNYSYSKITELLNYKAQASILHALDRFNVEGEPWWEGSLEGVYLYLKQHYKGKL